MAILTDQPASYEVVSSAGAGSPWIAMVHGVSQDHRVFDRQVEAFEQDFRLLLLDLPGHGRSATLPGPYGLQEYAASISGALDLAGVNQCHFWGTHLGAGAGLVLACEEPSRFVSMILEGPVFPGRPLPSVSTLLARISSIARTEGMAAARDAWWRQGPWFEIMRARPDECRAAEQRAIIDSFPGTPWLDDGLVSRALPPLKQALAALKVPVLIMNGQHDVPDFVEAADALAAIMPDCRRVEIEDAGGFPLWEFPERVNSVAADFLRQLRRGKRG